MIYQNLVGACFFISSGVMPRISFNSSSILSVFFEIFEIKTGISIVKTIKYPIKINPKTINKVANPAMFSPQFFSSSFQSFPTGSFWLALKDSLSFFFGFFFSSFKSFFSDIYASEVRHSLKQFLCFVGIKTQVYTG